MFQSNKPIIKNVTTYNVDWYYELYFKAFLNLEGFKKKNFSTIQTCQLEKLKHKELNTLMIELFLWM